MRVLTLLVSLSAFLPLGCVASVNPLASDETVEFDEELLGTWVDAEPSITGSQPEQLVISAGGNGYRCEYPDQPEPNGVSAKLVRLGNLRILDVTYAARPDDPPHYFALMSKSDGLLTVASLDLRKLVKIVKDKEPTLSIPKPTDKWPFPRIDWSTEQLQAFFGRYGESVFSEYAESLKKLEPGDE